MLRSTINLGAEYAVAKNRVSFGLLSSTRIYKPKAYTELTASVNYRPTDWFAGDRPQLLVHPQRLRNVPQLRCCPVSAPHGSDFDIGSDHTFTKANPAVHPGLRASASQPVISDLGVPHRERAVAVQAIAALLRIGFGQVLVFEK